MAIPPKRYVTCGQHVAPGKHELAVAFRKAMTPAERALWEQLRAGRQGFRFRRQQVIDGFIVDFYCSAAGLIVEVDGGVHDDSIENDALRTEALSKRGLEVMRVSNSDVLANPKRIGTLIGLRCLDRVREISTDAEVRRSD